MLLANKLHLHLKFANIKEFMKEFKLDTIEEYDPEKGIGGWKSYY